MKINEERENNTMNYNELEKKIYKMTKNFILTYNLPKEEATNLNNLIYNEYITAYFNLPNKYLSIIKKELLQIDVIETLHIIKNSKIEKIDTSKLIKKTYLKYIKNDAYFLNSYDKKIYKKVGLKINNKIKCLNSENKEYFFNEYLRAEPITNNE